MTVYNVLDNGAVGDGKSDDTNAIQRTIDTAVAAGAIVYFPPGRTYRITRTIRVWGIFENNNISSRKRGITLCGAPAGESYGDPVRSPEPGLLDSAVILWDPEVNEAASKINRCAAVCRHNRIQLESRSAVNPYTDDSARLESSLQSWSANREKAMERGILPMVELWTRDCVIADLHFACAKHRIAYAAIQMTRPLAEGAGNTAFDTCTNNRFTRVSIGHNDNRSDGTNDDDSPAGVTRFGSFVYGITIGDRVMMPANLEDTGALRGPFNCDYGLFESCRFNSIIEACVFSKNETGQAKHHLFDRCSFGFAKFGIWFKSGSFRTAHCAATNISQSIYHISSPTDSIEIRSMDVETCRRLFTSHAGSSNPWPVTIDGGRFEVGDSMYPVTEYISFAHHGPLTIRGAMFHGANPGFYINATNGSGNPVQVILEGCAFPNENPLPESIATSFNRWYVRGCEGIRVMADVLDLRDPEVAQKIDSVALPDLTPGIGRTFVVNGRRGVSEHKYTADEAAPEFSLDVIAGVPIQYGPSTMVDLELRATATEGIQINEKESPSALWAYKTFFNRQRRSIGSIPPEHSTDSGSSWGLVLRVASTDELQPPFKPTGPIEKIEQQPPPPPPLPPPVTDPISVQELQPFGPLRDVDLEIEVEAHTSGSDINFSSANGICTDQSCEYNWAYRPRLRFRYCLNSNATDRNGVPNKKWSPYFLLPIDPSTGKTTKFDFPIHTAGLMINFLPGLPERNETLLFKIRPNRLFVLASSPKVKNGTYWYGTIRVNSALSSIP